MRRIFLLGHRWLGLTAGLIFAIAAATGGILVFEDELNELLAGPRVGITPGLVDPGTIELSVRGQYPDSRLIRVVWPTPDKNVFTVGVRDGQRQQFFDLDGGSGAIVPPRPEHIILKAVQQVHTSLLMGSIGRTIVRYTTFASIVSLLLGLFLWWPGIRGFARGFRIRLGRGFYALMFDTHQTFGVITLPFLIVMTVTGVLIDRPASIGIVTALLEGRETVTSWNALKSIGDPEQADIDLATAVRISQAETGALPGRVEFPVKPNGVIEVWTRGVSEWPHNASTRLALDRHTGAVLARQNLAYDAALNDRLHFGSVGGSIIRGLYSVSCVVGAGLLVTGIVMWWKRKRPKRGAYGADTNLA